MTVGPLPFWLELALFAAYAGACVTLASWVLRDRCHRRDQRRLTPAFIEELVLAAIQYRSAFHTIPPRVAQSEARRWAAQLAPRDLPKQALLDILDNRLQHLQKVYPRRPE